MSAVRPNGAAPMWSDGDLCIFIYAAAAMIEGFGTARFIRAVTRWQRAMDRGSRQMSARTELRGAAIGVCQRARRRRLAADRLEQPTTTPEDTLREAGVSTKRQARYQRRMSSLLAGRA